MHMKIIGIMGGMGPNATVDLYSKIIAESRRRGARLDQDHLEVIISSVPQTPDRTEAILRGGEDPTPELIRSARRLEAAGADFLVIACNTAHYFKEVIRQAVQIPLVDAIALSAAHIVRQHPGVTKAGILATDATIATRLYQTALETQGIEPLEPSPESQKDIMSAIYGSQGLKSVDPSESSISIMEKAASELVERGAQVVIAGCTEIPLAFSAGAELDVPLIDATAVLAEAAVEMALGLGCGTEDVC